MSHTINNCPIKGSASKRSSTETSSSLRRALALQGELKKRTYPNAFSLAALCGCSRSTAMRTIDRLRYEFGVPLDYDESNRGYYLTNPDFSFASLPPGREELVALILLSEIASIIDDSSFHRSLSSLWARITNGRTDVDRDLELIRNRFSSDNTSIAKLADGDLLRLLTLSHRGQLVVIRYQSPWRHTEDQEYASCFDRLHFSDGTLYALFKRPSGCQIVLNVSFIKEIREVTEVPPDIKETAEDPPAKSYWVEGFGIWSGQKPEIIEVTIAPPASRYYAAQMWHPEQEDSWNGDILVRKFPGVASLELTRRVLGLGRFVLGVKPADLFDHLHEDVASLTNLCRAMRAQRGSGSEK